MLDRQLQRSLLQAMRAYYPAPMWGGEITKLAIGNKRALDINLAYLVGHGLVECSMTIGSDGSHSVSYSRATITARGMDFLEDDGGLSAILGVVIVRLHADTLRELLTARVEQEPALTAEQKSTLRNTIKNLSETALTEATRYLLREGLAHLPNAIHWLQTLPHP